MSGAIFTLPSSLAITPKSVIGERRVVIDPLLISDFLLHAWLDAYSAHFQTQEDCRGTIDFPLDVITGKEAQF